MRFRGGVIVLRRGLREELSFGFVAGNDSGRIVIFTRRSESDGMRSVLRDPSVALDVVDRRKLLMAFVNAAKLILLVDVRGGTFAGRQDDSVGLVIVPGDRFGAGGGDGLQQEVAELGEGGGFLARDAVLREQAKHLAESAVHACGGGEGPAGRLGVREGERAGYGGASRVRNT